MLWPVPALDEGLLPALARVTRRVVRQRGRHLRLQQQQQATGKPLLHFPDMHDDQKLDGEGVGAAEMARQ